MYLLLVLEIKTSTYQKYPKGFKPLKGKCHSPNDFCFYDSPTLNIYMHSYLCMEVVFIFLDTLLTYLYGKDIFFSRTFLFVAC